MAMTFKETWNQTKDVISNVKNSFSAMDISGIVGATTLATITGISGGFGALKELLTVATSQPSLCFVPIQTETINKRRRVDVSTIMLTTQTNQKKEYVTDNSAPQPRTWSLRGYLVALAPEMENGLLIKPTLQVQEAILDAASESRQTVKFKTPEGEVVDVLIVDLDIGSNAKTGNAKTISVTVQEVKVLESATIDGLNLGSVAAASVPQKLVTNLGASLVVGIGVVSSTYALLKLPKQKEEPVVEAPVEEPDTNKVATPVPDSSERVVPAGTIITLSCDTPGAVIIYTTDGSQPEIGGTKYTDGIQINANTTIKARAFKSGMTYSNTMLVSYAIAADSHPGIGTLTVDVPSGEVTRDTNVTITAPVTAGVVKFLFTTDGSMPDYSSPLLATGTSAQLLIHQDVSYKILAVKEGYVDSEILELDYTIQLPSIGALQASVPTGSTVARYSKVTISPVTFTGEVTFLFTTDGSTPNKDSPALGTGYSTDFTVTNVPTASLKVLAIRNGYNDSEVLELTYNVP